MPSRTIGGNDSSPPHGSRAAREVEVRKAVDSGRPLSEIFDIQSVLKATGVEEYERTWKD